MSVKRFDRAQFRKPVRTREGWLRADGLLTRTGVFEYRLPDGTVRRELRTPEEVFHPDSLESFSMVPLTLEHPAEPVTSSNWKKHAVGSVGDTVARDGDFVRSTICVTDAAAIADVEAGKRRELSCGYTCDVLDESGWWNGTERYDAVQKNIRGNHLALVTRGRAGPEVRMHLDAADAVQVDREDSESFTPRPGAQPGAIPMVKVRIDGVEYEVSEQAKQALEKQSEEKKAEEKKAAEELAAAKAEAEKEKGRADALAEAKVALEKQHKDATDPARIAAQVKARVALQSSVAPHLPATVKLDELSDRDVKVALLTKVNPTFKADGLSDDNIQGRFEVVLESLSKKAAPSALDKARRVAAPPPNVTKDGADDVLDPVAAARERMKKDAAEAWKKKSSAA